MRYKRFRGRRRVSRTNVVKMKFQSFVDISTQADNMQIISINAGGKDVIKRLAPFFAAYKYYKLGNVSIKMIPASTLPVDPTGLSYSEDDFQTVDPRDQLTPGMCRITNGEDILENITGLTGDQQRQLYDNMLLDSRWYKWMLQSGVKRSGSPRYWQIGQLHQDKWPGAVTNIPWLGNSAGGESPGPKGTININRSARNSVAQYAAEKYYSDPRGLFQTGHRGVLGWMPTDGLQPIVTNTDGDLTDYPLLAAIPEVELFKILMPPMHKTNYYYRMFVTETVYFRDPIVMNVNGFAPIDVFHRMLVPAPPVVPTASSSIASDSLLDQETGGNDGSH